MQLHIVIDLHTAAVGQCLVSLLNAYNSKHYLATRSNNLVLKHTAIIDNYWTNKQYEIV